jgi:hypothetical protein
VRFDILSAAIMNIALFPDVIPCILVEVKDISYKLPAILA